MIKLEDFVSETLKQIIDGTVTAQEYAATHGATVNPQNTMFEFGQGHDRLFLRGSSKLVEEIEFDVVVTTVESTGTEGGIGVFVGPVALGSKGKSDGSHSSESRISFSVPLQLPTSE